MRLPANMICREFLVISITFQNTQNYEEKIIREKTLSSRHLFNPGTTKPYLNSLIWRN